MKTIIAIAALLCCSVVKAQQQLITRIITNNTFKQPLYRSSATIMDRTITVPCAFGQAALDFPADSIDLATVQVTAIDLVFTDYPSNDALLTLNSKRLQHLFYRYPSLKNDANINWQLIRQTAGAEKDAAVNLFHGFVIYYRPLQNKATIQNDLIKLKESLTPVPTGRIKKDAFAAGDTSDLRNKYEIEEYTTVLKMPVMEALRFLGLDEKEKTNYKGYDSLYVFVNPSGDSSHKTVLPPPLDSTVIKVFDRMPWKDMLVVADVTASMYPYTGQLLYWLKLHEEERRIKTFAFFNDGDDKDDEAKVTGNTGGVYTSNSSVFEVVEQLLYKTMSNGNGGNVPENDIEALMKSSVACINCRDIILIADNAAAVSDMSLLSQLHQPVHIILCGVRDAINPDYLNIAWRSGGSVHIAEEDILLNTIKEGETITARGRRYKIVNGKFKMDN